MTLCINTDYVRNKTIRLIYPQWQGGDIIRLVKEIPNPDDVSRGSYLGAQLLNFLSPHNEQKTFVVPISTDIAMRKIVNGVLDRDIILEQSLAALNILNIENPYRIITLGGECSVSVVPFTYLYDKYDGDVAMIWLDAHPDITLPDDLYSGYHAMAVTACMGYGEKQLMSILPGKIEADKILLIGVRNWEHDEIKMRQKQYGITNIRTEEIVENSNVIREWLKSCRASKVMIHFDLDVLDPTEIIAAAGSDPNGMKIEQAIRIINDIANEKELIALTIAEPMPRIAIKIKNMLEQLPLFKI